MPGKQGTLNFDIILLLVMLFLIFIGIAAIYSAGFSPEYNISKPYYLRQFVWFAIASFIFALITTINYQKFLLITDYFYFGTVTMLLLTLFIGKQIYGTRGWISIGIMNFQFSELSKIAVIFMLAKYIDKYQKEHYSIRDLIPLFIITAIPMFLILLQPDFGTAIILPVILLGMLFITGVSSTHITGFITISLTAIILPLASQFYSLENPDKQNYMNMFLTNNYLLAATFLGLLLLSIVLFILNTVKRKKIYKIIGLAALFILIGLILSVIVQNKLKPYQQKRLLVFLDSKLDPYGAGYNIKQSIITIGSGKIPGKGFLKGTQSHLGFLPARQNDFIFSVICEEFGLIGATIILLLISTILLKGIETMNTAKNLYGSLLAAGATTLFIPHFFINIGMTTGIMPIAGLPLPFLSYGGSFLVVSMISVGIIMNVKMRRYVH